MNDKSSNAGDRLFGDKIKFFREKKDMKQHVLADEMGISQSEISRLENGTTRVSEEVVIKLARILGTTVPFLTDHTSYAPFFVSYPVPHSDPAHQNDRIVAYFASALTGLSEDERQEIAELDEKVYSICANYSGYNVGLYRPRLITPPENQNVTPQQVYETDQDCVAKSDLIFLAAIFPSLGAGMELQLALQSCTSIILIKKKGERLSKMVQGCPAIIKIVEYEALSDLEDLLVNTLNDLLPSIMDLRQRNPWQEPNLELGERIRQLRIQRNYKRDQLARRIGVDESLLISLESKSEQIVNPSITLLRRIADSLITSVSYLVSGQHNDPIFAEHYNALSVYADETGMAHREVNRLWLHHTQIYRNDLSMSGVKNRAEVGTLNYWKDISNKMARKEEKGAPLFE